MKQNFTKIVLSMVLFTMSIIAKAQNEGTITITNGRAYATQATLNIEANGAVTIEGATGVFENGKDVVYTYNEGESKIKFKGDITRFTCKKNSISEITFENCNSLRFINCSENLFIQSLDLSQCPNLDSLFCTQNKIATLNLDNTPRLSLIDCGINQLTTLDLSNHKNIQKIFCYKNKKLKSLLYPDEDIVEVISCFNCSIEQLNVAGRKKLRSLVCNNNKLTEMNIAGCSSLIRLHTGGNQLKEIVFGGNEVLADLQCENCKIEKLDLRGLSALKKLYCYTNSISELDLSHTPDLEILSAFDNKLSNIDLSHTPGLLELFVYQNNIPSLQLSDTPLLNTLHCADNPIATLDLSPLKDLETLFAYNNQLTELDFSNNPKVYGIEIYGNMINSAAMTRLVYSLPVPTADKIVFMVREETEKEQNICNTRHVEYLKEKNWIVRHLKNDLPKLYSGSEIDESKLWVKLLQNENGKIAAKDLTLDLTQIPANTALEFVVTPDENFALTDLTVNGTSIFPATTMKVVEHATVVPTFGVNTAVNNIDYETKQPAIYYNLSGKKLSKPEKGINIVVYEDGSVSKTIIK